MTSCNHLQALANKLARRAPLDSAERDALIALPHRVATYGRSSFLARESEPSAHCCVLLGGFAYSYKITSVGSRQIVALHQVGDLLDFYAVNGVSSNSIQPLGAVSVAIVARADLKSLAREFTQIGDALWADANAATSILSEWMLNLGRRSAHARIAHFICEMVVTQYAAGLRRGPDFIWPVTQDHLADATGLTSVHVNRTLQRLRGERLIRTTSKELNILDWESLKAAAEFDPGYLQIDQTDFRFSVPVWRWRDDLVLPTSKTQK